MTPRQLLLVDGVGALLTTLVLGLVLARLEPQFGMPRHALVQLAESFSADGCRTGG